MILYKVFYSEITEYEDYIEAKDEAQAEEIFKNSLDEELLDPLSVSLVEFDISEAVSYK